MSRKIREKTKLLFTDTDSLTYKIETKDFYKDTSEYVESKFDTSNFPKDHPSGIPVGLNKKVIGMFKNGKIMQEFVGLRAKLYGYKMYEGDEEKSAMESSVVKNEIIFEDYKDCLFGNLTDEEQMRKNECD